MKTKFFLLSIILIIFAGSGILLADSFSFKTPKNENVYSELNWPVLNVDFEIKEGGTVISGCENDIPINYKGDISETIALVDALMQPGGYFEKMNFGSVRFYGEHSDFKHKVFGDDNDWNVVIHFICENCINKGQGYNNFDEIKREIEGVWNKVINTSE